MTKQQALEALHENQLWLDNFKVETEKERLLLIALRSVVAAFVDYIKEAV